jgi:hypothetical protein
MFGFDPASRLAVSLRRWRGRIGISAPRLAIKTELPWHWRALSMVFLGGCSLALAGWIYDSGSRFAGFHMESSSQELAGLRDQVEQLRKELEQATKIASSSDSRLKIESTAQDRLVDQLKSLEEENIRLKADLAMFENLAGNEQGPPGLEISRLQLHQEGDKGQYRFRLLIAQKGLARDKEFKGNLQLTVSALQGSQVIVLNLPSKGELNPGQYSVLVRRFGRVEGVFRVPSGVSIQRVEARVLESGVVKAASSITL